MDGQDWEPVVWRKKTVHKSNHKHTDPTHIKWKQLENNENEPKRRSTMMRKTIEYGKQIVRYRTKMNMTQSELATKLNISIHKLKQIETGEERASDALRTNMNRIIRNRDGPSQCT